jgi:hypothetical protein
LTVSQVGVTRKLSFMFSTICVNLFIGIAKVIVSLSTYARAEGSNIPKIQRGCSFSPSRTGYMIMEEESDPNGDITPS